MLVPNSKTKLIENFCDFINYPAEKISITKSGNYEFLNVVLYNAAFSQKLIDLGLMDKKEESYFPTISEKLFNKFVAGLWNGKGSLVHRQSGESKLTLSCAPQIIDKITEIFQKNGISLITKTQTKNKTIQLQSKETIKKFLLEIGETYY